MGARNRGGRGFSYRPARLHRLAESFLGIDSGAPYTFKNTSSEHRIVSAVTVRSTSFLHRKLVHILPHCFPRSETDAVCSSDCKCGSTTVPEFNLNCFFYLKIWLGGAKSLTISQCGDKVQNLVKFSSQSAWRSILTPLSTPFFLGGHYL
jgi:hypothetical protein